MAILERMSLPPFLVRALVAGGFALLAACDPQPAAKPPEPPQATVQSAPAPVAYHSPALWVVRDADTTIYLFGTFHMLKPGASWFDGAIRKAFEASDTLVTEIKQPDNPMALGPATIALATDPDGPPLSRKLHEAARAPYRAFVEAQGLRAQSLERYEAWYVASALATARYRKLGLDPKAGAERILVANLRPHQRHEALETPEAQLAMLDSVPEAEQIDALAQLVTSKADPIVSTDKMLGLWLKGDADTLAASKNGALYKLPDMARIMLFERNRRWAAWIKQRMAHPGTVFIAVGAGHLAGQNSVQHYLATDQGLNPQRIKD